jgi:hypothetical protein
MVSTIAKQIQAALIRVAVQQLLVFGGMKNLMIIFFWTILS